MSANVNGTIYESFDEIFLSRQKFHAVKRNFISASNFSMAWEA